MFLFYLLILLLPTQLGYHFWPDWALTLGLRIDYLSPTVYLTDIIVFLILGDWFIKRKSQNSNRKSKSQISKLLIFTCLFLLINCLVAENKGAAVYKLIKIAEFSLLGVYISRNVAASDYRKIGKFLSLAMIYSCLMALGQFFKQGTLGGIFWWLGERTFNSTTPGIAQMEFWGRELMRPYGTFGHPNALAGFLLVAGILILKDWNWSLGRVLAIGLGLITIFLCFSRTILVVGLWSLVFGLWSLVFGKRKRWVISLLLVGMIIMVTWLHSYRAAFDGTLSWQRRVELNRVALEMMKASPLLGVGINNFIPRLPDFAKATETISFLQPVHNLFLLIGAETGLIGLGLVLFFLYRTLNRLEQTKNRLLLLVITGIILTGMTDHYWLTLQQNQLLLTIVFGLAWRRLDD